MSSAIRAAAAVGGGGGRTSTLSRREVLLSRAMFSHFCVASVMDFIWLDPKIRGKSGEIKVTNNVTSSFRLQF